jgi:hypothetical protein
MKLRSLLRLARLLLPVFLLGCGQIQPVLDLQQVQTQFDAAVQRDNLVSAGGSGAGDYARILASLDATQIAKLPDAQLKANAWMMRGIAEWRTGNFTAAQDSAAAGLRAGPLQHSRDHILLLILPALAIDSQLVAQWEDAGKSFTPAQYAGSAEKDYPTAFDRLDQARAQFADATDDETRHLVAYHRWRLLLNWDAMINGLNAPEAEQDAAAQRAAASFDGRSLSKLARATREGIPETSQYRRLADAQRLH